MKLDSLYKAGLLTNKQYSTATLLKQSDVQTTQNPHTYRPICPCTNSITTNLSSFLDYWLKQAVFLLPTYIRDTTHLIQTLENKTFDRDILLCTVDVTKMYTNMPTEEGNQTALRALKNLKTPTQMSDLPGPHCNAEHEIALRLWSPAENDYVRSFVNKPHYIMIINSLWSYCGYDYWGWHSILPCEYKIIAPHRQVKNDLAMLLAITIVCSNCRTLGHCINSLVLHLR